MSETNERVQLVPIETGKLSPIETGFTPEQIEARLNFMYAQKKAFIKFIRSVMKENIHYRSVGKDKQGKPRPPFLQQQGCTLVGQFFRAQNDYIPVETTLTEDYYAVTMKCIWTERDGTQSIGLGWANSREEQFADEVKYKGVHSAINNISQKARTRALRCATKHLPFVSELFSDDDVAEESDNAEIKKKQYNERLNTIFGHFKELGDYKDSKKIREIINSWPDELNVGSLKDLVQNEKKWKVYEERIRELLAAKQQKPPQTETKAQEAVPDILKYDESPESIKAIENAIGAFSEIKTAASLKENVSLREPFWAIVTKLGFDDPMLEGVTKVPNSILSTWPKSKLDVLLTQLFRMKCKELGIMEDAK